MIQRCLILTVVLLGAWAARTHLGAPHRAGHAESLSLFPVAIGPWTGEESPLEPDVVKTAAVDDYVNRYYHSGNAAVGLYVGYYKSQRQGQALHSPLFCLPGQGWEPAKAESINVVIDSDSIPRTINELIVEKGVDRLLVLYWYQTLYRVTASEYWRKIFLVKDAFSSGRTDVALVRVIAPIESVDQASEARALNVARPFAGRVLPELQKRLFRE
jgi:EpsI family protein